MSDSSNAADRVRHILQAMERSIDSARRRRLNEQQPPAAPQQAAAQQHSQPQAQHPHTQPRPQPQHGASVPPPDRAAPQEGDDGRPRLRAKPKRPSMIPPCDDKYRRSQAG